MKYINKTTVFKEKGDRIVYRFLTDAWMAGESKYIGLTYENFRKPEYKEDFVQILREEQYHLCCYCMRNLTKQPVTVEHIIPQSCTANQYATYVSYSEILKNYVELSEDFMKKPLPPQTDLRKYPHITAYSNLAISCNGISDEKSNTSCMCNRPRGNKEIVPLMLLPDCQDWVGYLTDGTMYTKKSGKDNIDATNTIKYLNLNYERLQEIRRLWYLISKHRQWESVEKADVFIKKKLLLTWLFEIPTYSKVDDRYKKYMEKDFYWNLLMEYKWFYGYYYTLPV